MGFINREWVLDWACRTTPKVTSFLHGDYAVHSFLVKNARPFNRGEADICTAGLSVVLERTFFIDYTVSVRKNDIGITVLASNAVTLNIWGFADVFLGTLWFGILGAAVTLMIMFVLVRVIIGKRFHMDDDPEKFDMWNAFALVTMVFMQRDYFFQKLSLTSK